MSDQARAIETHEERLWHDGFIVHPPLATHAAKRPYLRRLTDAQWETGRKLLLEGFSLGIIANAEEACAAVAECAARFKVPLVTEFFEDDLLVVIALDGDAATV